MSALPKVKDKVLSALPFYFYSEMDLELRNQDWISQVLPMPVFSAGKRLHDPGLGPRSAPSNSSAAPSRPQEAYCAYAIILMALLWCTEALPLAVTALFPIILFPMMGIMDASEVSLPIPPYDTGDQGSLITGGAHGRQVPVSAYRSESSEGEVSWKTMGRTF